MEESVVTETKFPALTGPYAESKGSALCLIGSTYECLLVHRDNMLTWRSLHTRGCFETMPGAFAAAKDLRCAEKSESEAREGWTERTTSLAR